MNKPRDLITSQNRKAPRKHLFVNHAGLSILWEIKLTILLGISCQKIWSKSGILCRATVRCTLCKCDLFFRKRSKTSSNELCAI